LPGFTVRAGQQAMAERIEEAIAHHGVFIAESGTGTGKTFAYLVPALLAGQKVLISTGTKNLQDQLFQRDLPLVREALGKPVTTALLKGRANYLCLYRLEQTQLEARFTSKRSVGELERIAAHARRTRSGDVAEIRDVPEDSELWPLVTSSADNCLGGRCPSFNDCFVKRAREQALAADVLIVNHHLFFADLVLREEGFGQLLPGVQAVIFDEAHQLPEIASNFFGYSVSGRELASLARDVLLAETKERSGVAELADNARAVEKAAADLRLAFGVEPRRDAWSRLDGAGVFRALDALKHELGQLGNRLENAAPKGEGLANCYRRAAGLLDRLYMLSESVPADYIAWFETTARGFGLHLTPLSVATLFGTQVSGADKAWVFTSATLTINGSFGHFQHELGLAHADTAQWDSPFDYANQTLLYLPSGLPEPSAPDYTRHVIEAALPVIAASGGRAFLLFTSHRALKLAHELLAGRIGDGIEPKAARHDSRDGGGRAKQDARAEGGLVGGFDYPLLVQGTAPKNELLARFRAAGNAVLLGTASFWEGVDVRGEALSLVIIDKLPFASPDDPVLQARAQAIEEQGGNAFRQYQLPAAVIALKQGAGRLIRDETDHGVLMLCDPRLLSKSYGKVFLKSLPPMPVTRGLADAERFFAARRRRNRAHASA
jgi:ATP-dependent DNA helicase DinG